MNSTLKKLLVVLPVMVVALFFLPDLYHEHFRSAGFKRIAGFVFSVLLLFMWITLTTIRRKQNDLLHVAVQASFFVYVFAVLQLTGYFILFKEISSYGWWDKMSHRVETDDNVNLVPFKTIDIYETWGKQNLGNFVMLLPLGIYLPLLYRKLRKAHNLFVVLLTCSSVPTGQRSNFLINDLVSLTEFGVGLQDAFGRPD